MKLPSPYRGCLWATLEFHVVALMPKFSRWLFMRNLVQIAPQMDKQSNRHTHNDQRTDTKDQEPPDHAHGAIRITEARRELSGSRISYDLIGYDLIGYDLIGDDLIGDDLIGYELIGYEAALRSAKRWRIVSTRLIMNCRRLRPQFVRVTTCSMVRKNSGSSSFLRSSLT